MTDTDKTSRFGVHIVAVAFEALEFAFREQAVSDFGIDAHVEPRVGSRGTGQLLAVQIKAGDSYSRNRTEEGWWVQTDEKHADYWLRHALPVILVKVDVEAKLTYWQAVTPDTVISTGKGRKILIPANQRLDSRAVPALLDQLTPIVPASQYTIVAESDVSHGLAKRYSYDIVLNGQLSKAQVATVARVATLDARNGRYYRNEQSRQRWEDQEADVVWLFIYPSTEDHRRSNWICRSQWIRPGLDESSRPIVMSGENVGDGVLLDWKPDYEAVAKAISEQTIDKRGYLDTVLPLADNFERLLERHGDQLDALSDGVVGLDHFRRATREDREQIEELYRVSIDLPGAPYECNEVDRRFQELAASIHNMALPHSERGVATWSSEDGLRLAQQHRGGATDAIRDLRYEVKKIR